MLDKQHDSTQTAASAPDRLPAKKTIDVPSSSLRDYEYRNMDSAAKRKASGGATGESEGRPLKRQKVPVGPNDAHGGVAGGGPRIADAHAGWRHAMVELRDAMRCGMGWWQGKARPGRAGRVQ